MLNFFELGVIDHLERTNVRSVIENLDIDIRYLGIANLAEPLLEVGRF